MTSYPSCQGCNPGDSSLLLSLTHLQSQKAFYNHSYANSTSFSRDLGKPRLTAETVINLRWRDKKLSQPLTKNKPLHC